MGRLHVVVGCALLAGCMSGEERKATGEKLQSPKSLEGVAVWLGLWPSQNGGGAAVLSGQPPERTGTVWEILGWTSLFLILTTCRQKSEVAYYPEHLSLRPSFLVDVLGIDPSVLCLVGKYSTTEVSLSLALSGGWGEVLIELLELALNLVCSTSGPWT